MMESSNSSNCEELDSEDSIIQLELLLSQTRYEQPNLWTVYEQAQTEGEQKKANSNKSIQFEQRVSDLQQRFVAPFADGLRRSTPANILDLSGISDNTLTDCIPEEKSQKFKLKEKLVNLKKYIGGKLFKNKAKVSPERLDFLGANK